MLRNELNDIQLLYIDMHIYVIFNKAHCSSVKEDDDFQVVINHIIR